MLPACCKFTKINMFLRKKMFNKFKILNAFRNYSSSVHISTPIFYVNAAPHIGHLYSTVMADAIHRTHQLLQPENIFLFSTGTDEHGLKIQNAAKIHNQSPQEFCNDVSSTFKTLFDSASIGYTDFIRTTERRHKDVVAQFWNELLDRGHIYKSMYKGWYCISDEAFLSQSDIMEIPGPNGNIKVSIESKQPVEWMEEENYMFALSKFHKDILHWLETNPVKPKVFCDILKNTISRGIPDLSISRIRSRLQWGIPVPNDETQTIYVWLDALLNYITVSGKKSQKVHIIGKDILKFHGIYWPAFLIAAGLQPPQKIICHSHWLVDNEKMSKSRGNVVDPSACIKKVTSEGLRYFLLREGVPHSDGNFTEEKLIRILNSELANTFGNLLSRCAAPTINKMQTFPELDIDSLDKTCGAEGLELINLVQLLPSTVPNLFLEGNFYRGLENMVHCLQKANGFVEMNKPWELVKNENEKQKLNNVLHLALESLRICGILLQPIIPKTTDILLTKLGILPNERLWNNLIPFPSLNREKKNLSGRKLHFGSAVVFPRLKL